MIRLSVFLAVLLVTACSHPLEIVGRGDIISSTGDRDCEFEAQPCENYVLGDYVVTYSAVPRDGWRFVGWENCSDQFPDCSLDVPAETVDMHLGVTVPPLRAVFEPDFVQPNILLILADDLAFDHYGFSGHPVIQTPTLDSLAAQSQHYPYAYVSSSCRPTLATLLTGLPEHVHGVTYIQGPQLSDLDTIADRLTNVGYTSVQAGKFWEGSPTLRGFTDFVQFDGGGIGNLSIGRTSIQPLLDLIDESPSPWFAWFSPYMPHIPLEAPQEYLDLYAGMGLHPAVQTYYGMISWLDGVIGELLASVSQDTVVIYLADNGYVQAPTWEPILLPRTKVSSYEHGIRTPLLIRHSGYGPAYRDELASAVDVPATILAMADAYRADLPGRDVLAPAPPEPLAFGSRWGLYGENIDQLRERWVRRGDWKLVDVEGEQDRLFNLSSDPDENNNLVDAPEWSALHSELQAELEAWWVQ